MVVWRFFFFQAEDGIRDYKVTGVQTCALPISLPRRVHDEPVEVVGVGRPGYGSPTGVADELVTLVGAEEAVGGVAGERVVQQLRSEERRVGKECRSRWSPYH